MDSTVLTFVIVALNLTVLALLGWGLWALWYYYLSKPIIDSTEIGIIKHWGQPETETLSDGETEGAIIYHSGERPFVPWIPIKFPGGYYPYELVRVPKKPLAVPYDLPKDKEYFWTSDHQRVKGQVIMYVAFPTGDAEAMLNVLVSGVPTFVDDTSEKQGLKSFFEDFLMSQARREIAKRDHKEITGCKDGLASAMLEIFKNPKSLPFRCGLYGRDPSDDTPCTGYVYVDMEQVELADDLRQKYGEKVTAEIDVDIAASRAAAAAKNAGVVAKAYADWLNSDEGKAATDEMKAEVFEAIRQGKLSQDGHYQEQINRNLIGSPDGSPLPSGLTYLSLGSSGGAGVLVGNTGKRGDKGGKQGGAGATNPPSDNPEKAAERYFKRHGKYPNWDPLKRTPSE